MLIKWKVESSHDNGYRKVVEVLAEVQRAEGPTEEKREYSWWGHERYKVGADGKARPKTGTDYKGEIAEALDAEFNPKVTSPCQCERT